VELSACASAGGRRALTAGKKYLGQIAYQDGGTTQGTTIVRVDS
jgi:hypothetical protein